MIPLLLTLVVTLTITPDADLEYLGALLCSECCGMPREAQQLTAETLVYDYLEHGRHWLPRRWYAPLKPCDNCVEIIRETLELSVLRQCRLVGSARDVEFWRAGGYIAPDAIPDYEWNAHNMTVAAFDCRLREAPVRLAWECEGERCPQ